MRVYNSEIKLFPKGCSEETLNFPFMNNLKKLACTLISLINVESTLTDFDKFHPTQIKNPPYTFIDFLDFPTLHSTFIRFMY